MSIVLQEVTERDLVDRAVLGAKPVLVGAGERSDVVLTGAGVSVRHARVGLGPAGPWVRDLGSTGGTWVNGAPTDGRHPLGPDDLVSIGDHLLRVRDPSARFAEPGPALAEALAELPEPLARRLRAEVLADRWEADAWRAIASDPADLIDRIDDRDALVRAIEGRLLALGVRAPVDEDFGARRFSGLDPAVARRVSALQRFAEPLLTRARVVGDLKAATKEYQRTQLERALRATGGNRAQAAERLGVSRQFVYRLLDPPSPDDETG